MAIVKVHNKSRNVTYVYESISYWDKELKQPRSHRKLIGRIDPATGDIVPTGKRAKADTAAVDVTPPHSDTDYKVLYEQALAAIAQKDALIDELRSQLSKLLKSRVSSADTWKPFPALVLSVIQAEADSFGRILELDRFRIASEDSGPNLHAGG
jgi:hypothetical protein